MASAMKEVAAKDVFPTVHAKVSAAMDRFGRDTPHAKDLRDFLTHLDAYMAGTGYKELPNPEHRVWLARPRRRPGSVRRRRSAVRRKDSISG